MPDQPGRNARLEAHITPDALAVVHRAAELQGRSVGEFVVAAAQDEAKRITARSRNSVFEWMMAGVMRLRPATMRVAAFTFTLALSVLASPRPDAPPPALHAPT